MRIARSLAILVALVLTGVAALYLYALPATRRLRVPAIRELDGVVTVEDAVEYLRSTRLREWDLVQAAQRLVAAKMEYSRRNSFDSPRRAFARGFGYCHQRALALLDILEALGVTAYPVYAAKCGFPATRIHEYAVEERTTGHVWLRVEIGGSERDVCPGSLANAPGSVQFTPRSPVRPYRGFARLGGQIGSIIVNTRTDNRAVKRRADA